MCSICGGTLGLGDSRAQAVFDKASDRGLDDCGIRVQNTTGYWLMNHRAIPTTEAERPMLEQPVEIGGDYVLAFNGTISNETEIMGRNPEVDTEVFQHLFDRKRLEQGTLTCSYIANRLARLKGSYAIAILGGNQFFLACNYKPLHVREYDDGSVLFSSLAHHLGEQSARVEPYTVRDIVSGTQAKIDCKTPNKALVIASAGLDSTVVASIACVTHGPENVTLLHFNYGCHATSAEWSRVQKIASVMHCEPVYMKLGNVELFNPATTQLCGNEETEIAQGSAGAEYAHEWVPARNMLMIATAVAYAEGHGVGHIYLGTNLEESGAYPDNEQQFIIDMRHAIERATNEGLQIRLHASLGNKMKHEIVAIGNKLRTPFELTWSCYRGGEEHCGNCGPCFMRRTAFERNGMKDPVQ